MAKSSAKESRFSEKFVQRTDFVGADFVGVARLFFETDLNGSEEELVSVALPQRLPAVIKSAWLNG